MLPAGARSTYALEPMKELVQRRRARLRPFRETVTARRVVVGSQLNRAGRSGLNELNIDASAFQRPVGQDRRDCWSGWRFALAHHMPRPVSVAHLDTDRGCLDADPKAGKCSDVYRLAAEPVGHRPVADRSRTNSALAPERIARS
jgi:hypothetical protein